MIQENRDEGNRIGKPIFGKDIYRRVGFWYRENEEKEGGLIKKKFNWFKTMDWFLKRLNESNDLEEKQTYLQKSY